MSESKNIQGLVERLEDTLESIKRDGIDWSVDLEDLLTACKTALLQLSEQDNVVKAHEAAIEKTCEVFKKNKSRMWVMKIHKEHVKEELENHKTEDK